MTKISTVIWRPIERDFLVLIEFSRDQEAQLMKNLIKIAPHGKIVEEHAYPGGTFGIQTQMARPQLDELLKIYNSGETLDLELDALMRSY